MRLALLLAAASTLAACGRAAPAPAAPPTKVAAALVPVAAREPAVSIPATCASEGLRGACAPGRAFAERACRTESADLALKLLARGTPWTRAYVTRGLVALSDSGRPKKTTLPRGEELVVLAASEPNPMIVGARATYQVMRWDGACFTLEDGEASRQAPRQPTRARIPWNRLEEATRGRLLGSPSVRDAVELRERACARAGDERCEDAERLLTRAIAESR